MTVKSGAMPNQVKLPSLYHSLSSRVLVLTVLFVLLAEVVIFIPSVSRFRSVYLEERLADARLASLSLDAAPDGKIDVFLADNLLLHAGVLSVVLRRPRAELMLGELPPVDEVFDLRDSGWPTLVMDAMSTFYHRGERTVRVIGQSRQEIDTVVDITLSEGPLWSEMVDYSWRIFNLSLFISALTALLIYVSLRALIIVPLRRITENIIDFRRRPEDAGLDLPGTGRRDEIGVVQGELRRMQQGLRAALAQKTRLAALGAAVSKINHDLRNMLASAILVSDRLELSQDPQVQTIAPRLVAALDRASRLCSETLNFSRSQTLVPVREKLQLRGLVDAVGEALVGPTPGNLLWRNDVAEDLVVSADRDQLFRVLMNLGRNAQQAMEPDGGVVGLSAWRTRGSIVIEIADTGPGIAETAREHLFEAFAGSTSPGGTGLGLPIAREILRAHGGEIELARSDDDGTVFRASLPERQKRA